MCCRSAFDHWEWTVITFLSGWALWPRSSGIPSLEKSPGPAWYVKTSNLAYSQFGIQYIMVWLHYSGWYGCTPNQQNTGVSMSVCFSTECLYTYFSSSSFSYSIDCYGVSRHGFMWIYNEHTTLCWQVHSLWRLSWFQIVFGFVFSFFIMEDIISFCIYLAEWRNWMAIPKPVEQLRCKSL